MPLRAGDVSNIEGAILVYDSSEAIHFVLLEFALEELLSLHQLADSVHDAGVLCGDFAPVPLVSVLKGVHLVRMLEVIHQVQAIVLNVL